jgi:hypothetical protein
MMNNVTGDQSKVVQQPTKICSRCNFELPLTRFRRKYRNRPPPVSGECHQCRNRLAKLERLKERKRDLSGFLTALSHAESIERVAGIVDTMTRHFGGASRLASVWKQSCDMCTGDTRMQGFAVRTYVALMRMSVLIEKRQSDELENLTTEDLERQATGHLLTLIENHPELAIDAARKLGWTLRPLQPTTATD